jgi:hypothetical protein
VKGPGLCNASTKLAADTAVTSVVNASLLTAISTIVGIFNSLVCNFENLGRREAPP